MMTSPRHAIKPFGPITTCQVCEASGLRSVLFLGYLPPVNRMVPVGQPFDQEPWFPAELLVCPTCHLAQLGYAVDPAILFPPEYPYTSGSTRLLRENFAQLYREARSLLGLAPDDVVVDIGSNDGTLLSNFQQGGHRVVGIEPSLTAMLARDRGIPTLMTFFTQEAIEQVRQEYGNPRLVTATNVFAHIHNVHQVMDHLEQLVGESGVFISESHYLGGLIKTLQYDTIYHEHLRYYSLTSLRALLESHGFRIFHVKRIPTHGGSIRVYASKSTRFPQRPSVERLLQEEHEAGLAGEEWIDPFARRVRESRLRLYELLARVKRQGGRIVGIGAPSRASTLLTYVGLDDGILDCVFEIAGSQKIGKYMPGTKIPVREESALYAEQPSHALLLSWHLASELCQNLKRKGYAGEFLVPLPRPRRVASARVRLASLPAAGKL